jgi:pimeloyl-ACP methyl ester carboxylesterase
MNEDMTPASAAPDPDGAGSHPDGAAATLPPGYERHEVPIPADGGGRVLDVVTRGATDLPALVYHSGTPSGPAAHELLADAAAALGFRYVNYGRPGYGRSTPLRGRSVADAVPDTLAVLDALGHDEFVTVGWSGGGPHALACAVLAADRCRGATIVAGVAPSDADDLDWTGGMGEENLAEFDLARSGGEDYDTFLRDASSVMVLVSQAEIGEALGDLVTESDKAMIAGPVGAYLVSSIRAAFVAGVDGWRDDDLAFLAAWGFSLEDVSVPVSLWQGTEDRMVPVGHGRWLAEHLPNADYEQVDGEGHISIWRAALPVVLERLRTTIG